MKKKLYIPDIECDSCVSVIEKVLKNVTGITSYRIVYTTLHLDYDDKVVKPNEIIKAIKQKGYLVYETPQIRKKFTDRVKDFKNNKAKYRIERSFLAYVLATFVILILAETIYTNMRDIPNYFSFTFIWIFYLTVVVVSISGALFYFKAYKTHVTCMTGMMIGMTFGMQTGMMLGPILANVIGFPIGATVAMLSGSIIGVIAGRCCGVMGIMEGLMAGIMGGVMGAMIGMMMMGNLIWFYPIYLVLNLIVIAGLHYMVYEEIVEGHDDIIKKPVHFWKFFLITATVVIIFIIMIDVNAVMTMNMPDMMNMGMDMMKDGGNMMNGMDMMK